ncbi:hypothetical protein BD847_2571 [Flavobacterium cutihirudinis]|uniref:Uncharacterized protein n=1 Tax=Flavobacterium cutihirudinis TaxID=1265740 RepID=A0A3D9FSB0_9FLAO|nr:hypothetical protein BD847_2571 [Flavobacterium cutihirudinis]
MICHELHELTRIKFVEICEILGIKELGRTLLKFSNDNIALKLCVFATLRENCSPATSQTENKQ